MILKLDQPMLSEELSNEPDIVVNWVNWDNCEFIRNKQAT